MKYFNDNDDFQLWLNHVLIGYQPTHSYLVPHSQCIVALHTIFYITSYESPALNVSKLVVFTFLIDKEINFSNEKDWNQILLAIELADFHILLIGVVNTWVNTYAIYENVMSER